MALFFAGDLPLLKKFACLVIDKRPDVREKEERNLDSTGLETDTETNGEKWTIYRVKIDFFCQLEVSRKGFKVLAKW